MTSAQKQSIKELRELKEECKWLVEIGVLEKNEAMKMVLDKGLSIIKAIRMPEPEVQTEKEICEEWEKNEHGYMEKTIN